MLDLVKQKKISFIAIIGLTLLLLTLAFWQVFFGTASSSSDMFDSTVSQYQNATKKITNLQNTYKTSIFNNQLFLNLRSAFRLPLDTGAVGKDNPFLLPLPPEVKK